MNGQIKFDEKYYPQVKNYLEGHEDLHGRASFGGDGRLYLTNSKKPSGFILQKCGNTDEMVLSVINDHPSFNKIKSDLGKIINN